MSITNTNFEQIIVTRLECDTLGSILLMIDIMYVELNFWISYLFKSTGHKAHYLTMFNLK